MDGLLGIGAAGGSSAASEGVKLDARLKTLREERAKRAPAMKKEPATVGAPSLPPTARPSVPQKPGQRKNKKKKKGNR